jgi:hypothetical protein
MIRSATSAKAEASIAYTRFAPARGRHREDGGGGPEVHDDVDGTHSLLDRTNQGERAIAVVEQLDVHLDTAPRQAKIPTLSRSLGTIGERAEIPEPGNEAARLDPVETGGPDARPLLNDVAKWSRRLHHRSEGQQGATRESRGPATEGQQDGIVRLQADDQFGCQSKRLGRVDGRHWLSWMRREDLSQGVDAIRPPEGDPSPSPNASEANPAVQTRANL